MDVKLEEKECCKNDIDLFLFFILFEKWKWIFLWETVDVKKQNIINKVYIDEILWKSAKFTALKKLCNFNRSFVNKVEIVHWTVDGLTQSKRTFNQNVIKKFYNQL